MSYRVRRHITSSTFSVNGQLCKVFLEPVTQHCPGHWTWNLGFAIGKSKRQLNDWYHKRKNKRTRGIDKHLTGKSGMKAFALGVKTMLHMRWVIPPGDVMTIDCTSKDPDKQLRAYWYWLKRHPEVVVDPENKSIFWYRPPYHTDPIWNQFLIEGVTPEDPTANTAGERYYDCFRVSPKVPCTELSMEQTIDLLSQVL